MYLSTDDEELEFNDIMKKNVSAKGLRLIVQSKMKTKLKENPNTQLIWAAKLRPSI